MTDDQKAAYLSDLYAVRQAFLDGMKSAKGKVTRMIDGQSVTFSGPTELMSALRQINAEIAAAEADNGGLDFGTALAVF